MTLIRILRHSRVDVVAVLVLLALAAGAIAAAWQHAAAGVARSERQARQAALCLELQETILGLERDVLAMIETMDPALVASYESRHLALWQRLADASPHLDSTRQRALLQQMRLQAWDLDHQVRRVVADVYRQPELHLAIMPGASSLAAAQSRANATFRDTVLPITRDLVTSTATLSRS